MTVLLCPLCSQPRFTNLESLRVSLVNAATQSISCPICDDILMGLDKLTIHLFGHTLNQNLDTGGQGSTSLELKTDKLVDSVNVPTQPDIEESYHSPGIERTSDCNTVAFTETEKGDHKYDESDKFFSEIQEPFAADLAPRGFQDSGTRSSQYNLCTVNMEDLSFLTSWESSVKPKQDNKMETPDLDACESVNEKQDNSDLSEYMSELLNKKMPLLNFSFGSDNTEKSKLGEKPPDIENEELKCGTCGFLFQNSGILSMHEELVHSKTQTTEKTLTTEGHGYRSTQTEKTPDVMDTVTEEKNLFLPENLSNQSETDTNNLKSQQNCENSQTTDVSSGNSRDVNDDCMEGTLPRYDCHLCSKSFKMKGSLLLHFRVAHFGLNPSESLQLLGDVSSPEERSHPCPICSKCFKKEQHLSQHVKTHEGKQWQCETCSKLFTTKYFLKKHQRLHTGEMPYSCSTCKKTFTFQQSYHKHLLYHSDEKPHQCTQCGRSFKELSTLHNHQRIHSGEKPFACETCGKCFRQRVSYIVHQRIHTGVLPYQCTACKKKFRYKVSQRSHKCTAQPPGIVVRQSDIVQKILESKQVFPPSHVG